MRRKVVGMQIDFDFLVIMFLVTFVFFTLMFVCSGVKVLKEWERAAVLRLGKFYRIMGPGIIWITPILDKIVLKVSLREQSSEIDTGVYIASDGSSRRLRGIILWRIVDVEMFILRIDGHHRTVNITLQHNVKKIAQSMTSEAVDDDTENLEIQIIGTLQPMLADWGIKITKVDFRTALDWESNY